MIRAANETDKLTVHEIGRLIDRSIDTIRDMRQRSGIPANGFVAAYIADEFGDKPAARRSSRGRAFLPGGQKQRADQALAGAGGQQLGEHLSCNGLLALPLARPAAGFYSESQRALQQLRAESACQPTPAG